MPLVDPVTTAIRCSAMNALSMMVTSASFALLRVLVEGDVTGR